MDNIKRAYKTMFGLIIKYALDNDVIISLVAAFKAGILNLQTKFNSIVDAEEDQMVNSKGETKNKKKKRLQLASDIFYVISPTVAYALATEDEALKEICSVPVSEIEGKNDSDIVAFANLVVNTISPIVNENPNPLEEYDVKPADIGLISTSLAAFIQVVNNPRIAIEDRQAATNKIERNVNEGNTILHDTLDKLSIRFSRVEPKFYHRYWNYRNLIVLGKGANMGFMLTVINNFDNMTVSNAIVNIDVQQKGLAKEYTTNEKGSVFIHITKTGSFSYTISGEDIETTTGTAEIEEGKITYLELFVNPKV